MTPDTHNSALTQTAKPARKFDGACAVLGLDVVAFSTFTEEDQTDAIQNLHRWITEALANHSIAEEDYRWSPAGDGGFLTFSSSSVCRKAIDVAFTVCDKVARPDWKLSDNRPLHLRVGLHAGMVQENDDLGRRTNIWGVGINMAARILSVTAESQILVSKQYFDNYVEGSRIDDFQFGKQHTRTIKHGAAVQVMNASRHGLGLSEGDAEDGRWQIIAQQWDRNVEIYRNLLRDAMISGDPLPALACGKYLLALNAKQPVLELCQMIGRSEIRPATDYPPQNHLLFSQMPPELLFKAIEQSVTVPFKAGETICERGDPARSCFFPVCGALVVDLPDHDKPIPIPKGQMTGEFTLWIPSIRRTARARALTDGLLLEIHNDRFRSFVEEAPDVANVIYGIIRRRIIENLFTSKPLFPGLDPIESDGSSPALASAVCEKIAPGETIDISEQTCFLFNGYLQIEPPDCPILTVSSSSRFSAEAVVGIVSEIGEPDGDEATVIEEAVIVRVPHDFLLDLQNRSENMQNAWNAICGLRLGKIRRAGKDGSR